jgi:hypothetical protein
MSAAVENVIVQLKTFLNGLPQFTNKVVLVVNEEDLLDKTRGIQTFPAVGIVYEGTHSVSESNAPSGKTGISSQLVITLIVVGGGTAILNTEESKLVAIRSLDEIRARMIATQSPTGHVWRFLAESPAVLKGGMLCWAQRWSTPVQFPPANLRFSGPK